MVEENNLNQNISALRRIFGETRGENRFIATVPGRGYCFTAEVRTFKAVLAPEAATHIRIGVLPFENLGAGAVAFFVQGCAGDQNPYPRGKIEQAQFHGRALAMAVEAALSISQPAPDEKPQKPITNN